ncbi:diguanylate cyclase [Thauera aromatica]|nr:diguanylate cyclase [Thauera aromatica]
MINAPFGDCKSAALHLADSIQPSGALLVIERWRGHICALSANVEAWLGMPPQALLDVPSSAVLPVAIRPLLAALRGEAEGREAAGSAPVRLCALDCNGRSLIAALHFAGPHLILELEAGSAPSFGQREQVLAAGMAALAATDSEEAAAQILMRQVADVTGYDRVMLYRFLPGWHGKVIDEVLRPGVEGFLGLHFPAGDVPANARRLYLMKRQRIIADVDAEPVPVLSAVDGLSVDLTHAELRAVHPVHVQYLKNMGVAASFSVSVVAAGRLWGLIACHHLEPKAVSFADRQLCEQLATVASIHMSDLQRLAHEQARHAHHSARAEARMALQASGGGKQAIATQLVHIRTAFGAHGGWARLDGRNHYSGDVPDASSLDMLRNWLDGSEREQVSSYDAIPAALETCPALLRLASGLLYIPLGGQDFIALLRAEQPENVVWAGRPPSLSASDDPQHALGPRTSFQIWREQTHGQANPWRDIDIEAAGLLREMLLEHVERLDLERMALTDPLTGLGNRAMFERTLQEAVDIGLRDDTLSALLMIDLDRFKPVNDCYGHPVGDALLIEVAERLRRHVRGRDVVARLGGDEFAVIQFHAGSERDVEAAAARILDAIRAPYAVLGHRIEIGASIGAALCPRDASEPLTLVERADLALYRVKHGGRDGFRLFDTGMLP